jgi:hypothetical protein
MNQAILRIAASLAYKNTSRLIRIAQRVARIAFGTLHLREGMLHIDPETVKNSSLSDELKAAFAKAFSAKNDFFRAIPMNKVMYEDDRAIDLLDKRAGSLVFALQGLVAKVRESGFKIDSKTKSAMKGQADHGFIPNPQVAIEANDWGWDAHEIISRLYDIAIDD